MSKQKNNKPIIMLNIDSLMPHALEYMTQSGKAPALQFLMEKGHYISDMVSSFPTMSVTIDSSILTGTYPDGHQIPSLQWFDTNNRKFINYGTGFRETFRIGLKKTVYNMLHQLNEEHMNPDVTTIYEDLAEKGIPSASINSFVYRGHNISHLKMPRLLRTVSPFQDDRWKASVPSVFSLGVFSKIRRFSFPTKMMAGNYKYVGKELRYLIRHGKLPYFTFCIFQDMDLRLHFKGPLDTKMIQSFDKEIQKILHMYPSWEHAIQENIWMIIGDNGHSATGKNRQDVMIDLRKLLHPYKIARIQRPKKQDEIAIGVNQRMAYVYALSDRLQLSEISKALKVDKRIDLIAWRKNDQVIVESGLRKGRLAFSPQGSYKDIYNQSWDIQGDFDLLNIKKIGDNLINYGDYPDAFARLYGALYSHDGRFIVVTAKPGCEFKAQLTPAHLSGGAHGSLHRQESLVPLIVAGTNQLPTNNRFVDLKDYILQLLQA